MHGWSRFLDEPDNLYNNSDLHDQLIQLQQYYGDTVPPANNQDAIQVFPSSECGPNILTLARDREQVTFLFEMLATNGSRKMLAGTHSRLYELNQETRNWRIIGDNLGGDVRSDSYIRWQAAQIRDTVILSNGIDIRYYDLDAGPSGCAMQSVKKVPDLDRLKIASAKAITSYKNMVLLGCTWEDGGWVENRVRWSNATVGEDAMLDWEELGGKDVAKGSVADFQDLDYGHKVMRMMALGDWLMVYTNIGIYRGNLTGGVDPFMAFEKIYESRAGDGCLAFPFTLVSTGSEHWWVGRDGIYRIDGFSSKPELVMWLHAATGGMFNEINREDCNGQVAGFDPAFRSIWFSWSKSGAFVPSRTLVAFPDHKFASEVDHGFTAFCTYRSDIRLAYRDFLRNLCVCQDFDFSELFLKEGLPKMATCDVTANWLWSDQVLNFDGEIETEDWWYPTAADDSLCTILGGLKPEDFCRECNEDQLFVAVSADDWCIKQMDPDSFGREMCTNPAAVGLLDQHGYHSSEGTYHSSGYLSRMVFGPLHFGDKEIKKNIAKLADIAEIPVEESAVANPHVSMKVGASYYPLDPTNEDCSVIWSSPVVRPLKCPLKMSADDYKSAHLAPAHGLEAPFYVTGRFLYLDIKIGSLTSDGKDVEAGIGGESYHSRLTMHVRKAGY